MTPEPAVSPGQGGKPIVFSESGTLRTMTPGPAPTGPISSGSFPNGGPALPTSTSEDTPSGNPGGGNGGLSDGAQKAVISVGVICKYKPALISNVAY